MNCKPRYIPKRIYEDLNQTHTVVHKIYHQNKQRPIQNHNFIFTLLFISISSISSISYLKKLLQ